MKLLSWIPVFWPLFFAVGIIVLSESSHPTSTNNEGLTTHASHAMVDEVQTLSTVEADSAMSKLLPDQSISDAAISRPVRP